MDAYVNRYAGILVIGKGPPPTPPKEGSKEGWLWVIDKW
jgi:hypothetical protein